MQHKLIDVARLALTSLPKKCRSLERQFQAVKDQFEVGIVTRTDVAQSESRLKRSQICFTKCAFCLKGNIRKLSDNRQVDLYHLKNYLNYQGEKALTARSNSPILVCTIARGAKYVTYSTVASLPQVRLFGNYSVMDDPTRTSWVAR